MVTNFSVLTNFHSPVNVIAVWQTGDNTRKQEDRGQLWVAVVGDGWHGGQATSVLCKEKKPDWGLNMPVVRLRHVSLSLLIFKMWDKCNLQEKAILKIMAE